MKKKAQWSVVYFGSHSPVLGLRRVPFGHLLRFDVTAFGFGAVPSGFSAAACGLTPESARVDDRGRPLSVLHLPSSLLVPEGHLLAFILVAAGLRRVATTVGPTAARVAPGRSSSMRRERWFAVRSLLMAPMPDLRMTSFASVRSAPQSSAAGIGWAAYEEV